ncbi:MAG: hypothetical protein LBK97_02085 [Prevotellaceae bacterium]|jgi:hypothetical protein|nr:hypothetical protein [Prevotellaceae bacterium]
MKEEIENDKWKHDLVEFVQHWTKEKCPETDSPAEILTWLNAHFADALYNFELDIMANTAELSIAVHKMLMPQYGGINNR